MDLTATGPMPLDGIRVLDFTWVISGPQCTQILADFGAEVIKAEWPHHLDGLRYRVQAPGADPASPEGSGLWNNLNRNKRGITLNMRHPDGARIALDLVEHCDVVVENFSPGVLDSWGLSWPAMRERNPRLVYLGMSGFGRGGPSQDYVVFAPVMHALSGLHAMTGEPGREPAGLGFSYGDHVAGYFGALAVIAALAERDATGQGIQLDLGQVEASLALTGTAILDAQASQRRYVAAGNVPAAPTTRRPGYTGAPAPTTGARSRSGTTRSGPRSPVSSVPTICCAIRGSPPRWSGPRIASCSTPGSVPGRRLGPGPRWGQH